MFSQAYTTHNLKQLLAVLSTLTRLHIANEHVYDTTLGALIVVFSTASIEETVYFNAIKNAA